MKTFKLLMSGLLIASLSIAGGRAQSEFSPGIGLALKASTNGIGGDAVYNFHKRMSIRLGFEKLGFKTDIPFAEQGIDYLANAHFEAGSISLLYDFYVLNHVYLTAGAGYNLFHLNVDGAASGSLKFGDLQIPKEMIGTFNIQMDPSMKISPYLGLGFGRTLGLKHRLGFGFELGSYYQGSPDLTILSEGLLSPTSNPDQKQTERLENQISQYTFWPVVKFSLSYKILSLK